MILSTNLTGIRRVPHRAEEYLSGLRLLVPEQHGVHAPVDIQAVLPELVRVVQPGCAELADLLRQRVGLVHQHGQAGAQLLRHPTLQALVAEYGQHLVLLLRAQPADLVPLAGHRVEIRVHRAELRDTRTF